VRFAVKSVSNDRMRRYVEALRVPSKVREVSPQARHGEVHKGTDLRDGKPALWCDDMYGQEGCSSDLSKICTAPGGRRGRESSARRAYIFGGPAGTHRSKDM